MKIVILDASAANPGDLSWARFEEFGEVIPYDTTSPDQLIDRAKDAEILFTNKTVFDKNVFASLPKLRYIGVLATGFNVVDLEEASAHGVTVTNVPEYATFATAQMAVALLLELTNRVGMHERSVKNGDWTRSPQFCYTLSPMTELYNKTAAVIGMGKIGQRVALMLRSFGMNVIAVPHKPSEHIDIEGIRFECSTLEEAAKKADVLTFHCPLTPETKGIISEDLISSLKDGAMIINTARGPMADEVAVCNALKSGKLRGYAADVVSVEPMAKDSPFLELKDCDNLVLTPHTAWAPKETRARLLDIAYDNLKAFLNGETINKVN